MITISKMIKARTDHHYHHHHYYTQNIPSTLGAWDVQNMYEGGRYAYIERKIKNYNTFEKGKEDGQEIGR